METNNHIRFTRLQGKLVKAAGSPALMQNGKEFVQQMNRLVDGEYDVIITPAGDMLDKLKRRYFVMESELARYLGFRKTELHEVLKAYIGRKINNDGKEIYESLAEVKDPDDMRVRIEELHELAALRFGYVFIDRDEEIIFSWKTKQ